MKPYTASTRIAEELFPGRRDETLRASMERIMLAAPENWAKYYEGSDAELALAAALFVQRPHALLLASARG